MNKIYSNADNHHVKGTVIYANEENVLFRDELFEKPFTAADVEELKALFFAGLFVKATHEGLEFLVLISGFGVHPEQGLTLFGGDGAPFVVSESPIED
jgi:hypothetical protein